MIEESQKESGYIRINNLGDFAGNSPGRPKGSKNKFTLIKEQMAEIWEEEEGKEAFRKIFKSGGRINLQALDRIISILPKEPLIDQSQHTHFEITWKNNEELPILPENANS